MIVKACVAGVLALAFGPVTPVSTFVENPYIEKISCAEGSGTGFKIAGGRWISVAHVASLTACKVDGLPIKVTYLDGMGDFAMFEVPGDHRKGGLKVDCSGFHDREWYHGQGHAGGWPVIESVPIMYSQLVTDGADEEHGWAILIYNRVIPGQSGGPVLNNRGEVTGTVNALGIYQVISFSKPLRDTPACQS